MMSSTVQLLSTMFSKKVGVRHRYIKKFYDPTDPDKCVTQLVRYVSEEEYILLHGKRSDLFHFPVEEDYEQYGHDIEQAGLLISKEFAYYPTRVVPVYESVNLYMDKVKNNPTYCIAKQSIQ